MFSKIFRINSRTFTTIFKKGSLSFNTYFRIKYLESDSLQVSVVIPKKIIKKRVNRNTEKRRIIHLLKNLIAIDAKYSYVFWLTRDSQVLNSKQLKVSLQEVLKKQR